MTTNCEMKCEAGWLPLDREEDHDAFFIYGEYNGQVYVPMLFPTQFVPCPQCNVLAMCNLVGETNGNQRHTTGN